MSLTPSPVPPSPKLSVESRWLSGTVVQIAVAGEIDLATAEDLEADLLGVILAGHPQRVEVDLAGVTFLDCRGLSVLVIARQAATRARSRLRITRPQPIVRHVLTLTGLLGLLTPDPITQTTFESPSRISAEARLRRPKRSRCQPQAASRAGSQ